MNYSNYSNIFIRNAKELRSKGTQLGQLHQIAKSGGLVVTGLSAFGMVASAGTLLPLIVGALTYGAAVMSENKRTGKLRLIPFMEDDLSQVAARSLHQELPQTLGTQAHHYLEPEDKALYFLTNFQGHRLTQLAHQLRVDEYEHVLINLVDHLVAAHLPALNHPELLSHALGVNFFEAAVDSLPSKLKEHLPPLEAEVSPPPRSSIGPNTRVRAVEAAVVTDAPVQASNQAQPDARVADDLANPVQNSLIIGKPGSGKGILLSNALRAVKRFEPDRTVFVIDPKADPLEQPYWSGCDSVASKPCQGLLPLEIWEWVDSCIQEFHLIRGPKLLVIDEIRFLSNTFARINDRRTKALDTFWYKVEAFTSFGDATRSHVWGVSQSSHTADLNISGGSLGQFRVIAIVSTADFGFYDTLKATNIVNPHPEPNHLRDVIAARSPVHRVYYDSKFRKWFPLPEMTNFSGRDRDNGVENSITVDIDSNTDVQPSSTRQSLENLFNVKPEKTPEEKVITYLEGQGMFVPAHQIKSAVAELQSMSKNEAYNVLHRMADERMILRRIRGVSVQYAAIGTCSG